MKQLISLGIAGMLILCAVPARAESGVAFGLKAGTLGAGTELGVGLNEYFGLRAGINYLKFSFDSTISNVDYDMEPEFKNGALLLDVHPFGGSFRLTGGMYINDNSINLSGTPRTNEWLGNYTLPSGYARYEDLLGSVKINGNVEFNTLAPYVGFGWDSNPARNAGLGFAFELGVLYQGSPKVSTLTVSAPAALRGLESDPAVVDALESEKKAIEDELDGYEYYPVATFTVCYIF